MCVKSQNFIKYGITDFKTVVTMKSELQFMSYVI